MRSFYVADASKDLEGYEGHFDVIHCRSVAGHVRLILQLPIYPFRDIILLSHRSGSFDVGFRPTSFDAYDWKMSQTGYVLLSSCRFCRLVECGLTVKNTGGYFLISRREQKCLYPRSTTLSSGRLASRLIKCGEELVLAVDVGGHGALDVQGPSQYGRRQARRSHSRGRPDASSGAARGTGVLLHWDGEDVPDGREIGQLMVHERNCEFLAVSSDFGTSSFVYYDGPGRRKEADIIDIFQSVSRDFEVLTLCLTGLLAGEQKRVACWRLPREHR